ncbi:Nucleoside-diphosphate-sugar epimerase [Amycolatopsis lurida]|uniref:NAD-dependent dehydratase n=1 Tax=Amycolatopsis lurida NRRL 2430 TaxID=1460371 RepID=A0A2P2FFK5_AMYLU|nr:MULTISPECIES: SDR family oxidoreductase [Amycolatopsis]KFU75479.1 NAD-dependent dehydratase [Amycolatopsis lurida NRRL 2430]QXV60110.1 NAD-dependent epimerase/dehydratase [Amycolatopsis sp. TNS106]SED41486.1 Nucleoside-diphosphate-sugar epimerase [Amycolatopsis lurida]
MRVLLTGHKGYLGTVMAPVLAAEGHEVVGLDSGLFDTCVLGPKPDDPKGYEVDLRDVTAEHVTGVDAVIHLAALSNDPLGSLAPELTYDINHRASVKLAKLAKDAGVKRFLYASTCSVYGASGGDGLVDEDAPLRPVTPYAESKVRVEDDLHALADDDFTPVYMRNATAFGFSPRLRSDIVLNNLTAHAHVSGEILVLSDGTPWRPLVHAKDIARAFEAALVAPKAAVHDKAFNIGTERNNVTVAEIAQQVVEAVPSAKLRITGESAGDPRSYRVDFSRFREAIPGFECDWSVKDGALDLIYAYRTHGLTAHDFKNRFTRLATLNARTAAGEIDETLRRR